MAIVRRTNLLLASRTAFQEFGLMPKKRDPDYERLRTPIHSFKDMFSGYLFPQTDSFTWSKPGELRAGDSSMLHWYTMKGMSSKQVAKSRYQDWYRQALGQVQYMDGYEYPELQDPEDLLEPESGRDLLGPVPIVTTGRAKVFALKVEELRTKPDRAKKDVESLIAEYIVWSDPSVRGYGDGEDSDSDILRNQPTAVYETLLILSAEHQDWVNVTALLREMGHRGLQFRSVVAAGLFEYVTTTQMGLNLFEVLKKENVRLHLHTYYALMRSLERIESNETALSHNAQWHEKGELTGDMVDFIV
eukprot:gene16245-24902_t